MMLAVVVALLFDCRILLRLLGLIVFRWLSSGFSCSFRVDGRALHSGVVRLAALGGNAAGDLVLSQLIAVVRGAVLAALIRVDQWLLRLRLAVTEGLVEGLGRQSSIHAAVELPADNPTAEQAIDGPPASCLIR